MSITCQIITLLLDFSEFLHEFHYVRLDQLRHCIQTCFLVSCSARVQTSHYRVKLSRNKLSSFITSIPQLIWTLSLTHATPLNSAARENCISQQKKTKRITWIINKQRYATTCLTSVVFLRILQYKCHNIGGLSSVLFCHLTVCRYFTVKLLLTWYTTNLTL